MLPFCTSFSRMHLLSVRLLGEFAATDYRGNALSIGSRRTQAFVIYLALRLGDSPSLGEAASAILGESADEGGVRDLVRDLRYALRFLPPALLIEEGHCVRFDPEAVDVDARRFAALADSPALVDVQVATEMYSGNLLPDVVFGAPFDAWIAEERLIYWRKALGAYGRLLAAQMRAGWWERAATTANRLLELDPTQEVVHRTLMRLQLEQGRPDAALRRYHECADVLRREQNRGPSAETEALREAIVAALRKTPAPRATFLVGGEGPVLVLVVEDDAVTAAFLESMLSDAGYEVVTVGDGADALMEIARRAFDALIVDVNVPTLNGLQLFQVMLQKGIDTPAIFISGWAGPEVEARSLEMGAADFFRKPVRKEQLLPRLRSVLQQRRATREARP